MPAYPNVEISESGETCTHSDYRGLSKREIGAFMAPNEIPDWFQCSYSIGAPKAPKSWADFSDDEPFKFELKKWHHGGCYDLPEELQWYQQGWDKYHEDVAAYEKLKAMERYFQWRIFFSENLLTQLQNTEQ